jgi:hypothetical protein
MEPIPRSGYYYANKFALIMIKALEDVMGKWSECHIKSRPFTELIENFPPEIWRRNLTSLMYLLSIKRWKKCMDLVAGLH